MRCAVKNCTSSQKAKNKAISFHRFPHMLDLKMKWINALGLEPNLVLERSRVCSKHFHENDFVGLTCSSQRLFPSAVPCIDPLRDEIIIESVPSCSCVIVKKEEHCDKENVEILENIQIPPPSGTFFKSPLKVCSSAVNEPQLQLPSFPTPELQLQLHATATKKNGSTKKIRKMSLKRAMESSDNLSSSPQKNIIKDKLRKLKDAMLQKNRKIKTLHQKVWRKGKRIACLKEILRDIKKKNLINEETAEILENLGEMNADLFQRKLRKIKGMPNARLYQPALRSFALNLNFLSPKAYDFVRQNFDNCLPHSRTLARWYEGIDCCPGFTTESFDAISAVVEEARLKAEKIILNLVFDEMAIRKHIDWSSEGSIGYTFIGDGDSSSTEATKILVFMVVCVNGSWKIPVGYFPITSLDASQKVNLIKHCMENILATGAEVVGLTFDGAAVNFTAARLLGADVTDIRTESVFSLDSICGRFCILPDPCHMIKLIRNFFAEVGQFKDSENNFIKWQYLQKLVDLQEKEQLHLGNKLKRAHVYFSNQKMKVRLAVQALSKSVADALDFCREVLLLPDFQGSEATVKFIRYMNNVFDILNSRNMYKFGFEKALCMANIGSLLSFEEEFVSYITQLRILNGPLVVNSRRKTGFLGIIACLRNIKVIYDRFIASEILAFMPFYKLNQDHLELFFGSIRSHLGHNDNPSVKQFKAAYKKLIIRCKMREGWKGVRKGGVEIQ